MGTSKLVSQWLLVTLVASIVAAVDGGFVAGWAALVPTKVLHGQLWRLCTWPFVERSPMSLVLTCAAIYKLGGELAIRWGDRRLRRFAAEVLLAAGGAACLLALVAGRGYLSRLGGWATGDMLVIAWARQFPEARLQLYGLLVLNGRKLVQFTLGVAVLFAIFFGPVTMAAELAACGLAAWYPRAWLERR
jgi:membrane associated rhomboid family serine protease